MALTAVTITDDVYFTCLAHALSTENEEVMGLLLGDIEKVYLLLDISQTENAGSCLESFWSCVHA